MAVSTFNAITYANKLKDAGMQDRIANVQAEEMSNFVSSTLATKEDLGVLSKDVDSKLKDLEMKITIRMGGMFIAAIAVLTFLLKH